MKSGKPSRTALAAARYRAVHQVLENGSIFSDPLAMRILGEKPEDVIQDAMKHPDKQRMRMFVAARSRLAEDALAQAVKNCVHQLVILGAGLDTYAYRSQFGDCLHIFEVDHPATQVWKRQRLLEAGIPLPSWLTFAPVDFEHETLSRCLLSAGFNPEQQAFFSWLGVVPYLTETAIWSALEYIASLPNGAHVVFDYSNSPSSYSISARMAYDKRASGAAMLGEAFITHFDTERLHEKLKSMGYVCIEDFGPQEIAKCFYPNTANPVFKNGGHIIHVSTIES